MWHNAEAFVRWPGQVGVLSAQNVELDCAGREYSSESGSHSYL